MINHISQRKKNDEKRALGPTLSPQIAGVDPFNTLPIRVEPYAHDLLKYCGSPKYVIWKMHTDYHRYHHWMAEVLLH